MEVLVVLGVVVLMMTLLIPAFNGIKGGQDLTSATYSIAGTLDQARAYAMANHTHVFVGFEEVNASNLPSTTPQVPGIGRVAVAVVASRNGTSNYGTTPGNWSSLYANGSFLTAISPLQHFENVHLSATAFGTTGSMNRPPVSSALQVGNDAFASATPFTWPLGNSLPSSSAQYSFSKVIEFDPQGAAWYQSSSNVNTIVQYIEICLQPARGAVVLPGSDIAAIQIDGMTGSTHIYRP